jgi:AcrR family transcriptional regulator
MSTVTDMNTKRSYTMGARAQAVEETRRRIQEALFDLCRSRMFPEISLEDVAREAGVSVQTVLRQFGSRAGLIEANIAYSIDRVTEERAAPVGDVDSALRVLLDHYELRGDTAMLMLAQESSDPQVGMITERGRRMHRTWVENVFAPFAAPNDGLNDLLVVATDVYTWKLLRRDRGLSRAQTEQRMKALVGAVLATARKEARQEPQKAD